MFVCLLGCEMFEITVTRNYNENTFKDDMKRMYNQLGVDGKPTVFLFTAAQVRSGCGLTSFLAENGGWSPVLFLFSPSVFYFW